MKEPKDRLQEARLRKGYKKPSEAADAFGWKRQTYYAHENGGRGLTPETARRYARAFGVSVEWLLDGTGSNDDPETAALLNEVRSLPRELREHLRPLIRQMRSGFGQDGG